MRGAKDIILCHATSAVAAVEKAEVSRTAQPSPAIEVVDSRVTVMASAVAASLCADYAEYGPATIKHRDHTAPRSPVRRFKKSSKR